MPPKPADAAKPTFTLRGYMPHAADPNSGVVPLVCEVMPGDTVPCFVVDMRRVLCSSFTTGCLRSRFT